jgi:rhodanese-related sulfurtransferase
VSDQTTIEPEDARDLLATGKARAIDLRPIEELGQSHAPSAMFVADEQPSDVADRVLRGDDVKLIVFCEDGSESADVAAKLGEGGVDAVAVAGGWRAWVGADMPVQPGEDEEYEGPELKQPGTGESLSEGDSDQDEVPDEAEREDESDDADPADAEQGADSVKDVERSDADRIG